MPLRNVFDDFEAGAAELYLQRLPGLEPQNWLVRRCRERVIESPAAVALGMMASCFTVLTAAFAVGAASRATPSTVEIIKITASLSISMLWILYLACFFVPKSPDSRDHRDVNSDAYVKNRGGLQNARLALNSDRRQLQRLDSTWIKFIKFFCFIGLASNFHESLAFLLSVLSNGDIVAAWHHGPSGAVLFFGLGVGLLARIMHISLLRHWLDWIDERINRA